MFVYKNHLSVDRRYSAVNPGALSASHIQQQADKISHKTKTRMVMKKIMIAFFLFAGTAGIQAAHAQVNVNINIGAQPGWGPTGYNHVDYYYFPDNNIYYDIVKAQYIYLNGRNWIFANILPASFGRFDPYNAYKVVVNGPNPYQNNKRDRTRYGKYKGQHNPHMIRDSRDSRYYESYQHPQHQQWVNQHQPGNQGNGKDNGRKDRHRGPDNGRR